MREPIQVGFQTFLSDGGEEFGAIREITGDELVVYVENAGEFRVPLEAVSEVHSHKVILDRERLDPALQEAIRHAHDSEVPGL